MYNPKEAAEKEKKKLQEWDDILEENDRIINELKKKTR